jgi:hypothetical protein
VARVPAGGPRGRQAGATARIAKPVSPDVRLTTLKKVLD